MRAEMITLIWTENRQMLSSVWSSRKERAVAVRIQYQKEQRDGCKIYTICKVEELD
jgi:hypothetical protein